MNIKFLLFIIIILTLNGCMTSYGPMGFSGGYSDNRTSRNTYNIAFSGNGYTSSQRAFDLCLLRAAELSINNGYNYFAVETDKLNIDNSMQQTIGNYVPVGRGGFYSSSTTTVSKPSYSMSIISFIRQPVQYAKYYDAKKISGKIIEEYLITLDNTSKTALNDLVLFKKSQKVVKINPVHIDEVEIIEGIDNLKKSAIQLSGYADYEMPYDNKDDLIMNLRRSASEIGADLVVYDDNYNRIQRNEKNKKIAFIAVAFKKQASKMGFKYDKAKIKEEIYLIDSYDMNSNFEKAGLLIGDRVVSIDHKEPMDTDLLNSMVTWEVGREVMITIVRNGKQIGIPLKTVSNL